VIAARELKTGSEVLFSDSTEIDVEEVFADSEIMMGFKPLKTLLIVILLAVAPLFPGQWQWLNPLGITCFPTA
jgi:hypothetical protein